MKSSLSWWLNVSGLFIGATAAALMFYFPPRLQSYSLKGEAAGQWIAAPTERGKRLGQWQTSFAKIAPVLLGLAFSLQLLAAVLSA